MKKFWSGAKYYIFLAIGALLLYFVFKDVDFRSLWKDILHADFRWLALSFLFGVIAMMSRAQRWRIVLEPLGHKPGFINCFNGVSLGYFANIAFPRMGEVVRCTTLNQTEKIPVNQLIGTVVVERLIDVMMLLSLIVIVIFSQAELFGNFFMNNVFGEKLNTFSDLKEDAGIWLYLIPLALVTSGFFLIRYFLKRFGENSFVKKVRDFSAGIAQGFIALFKMKNKGAFIFHTLFIWFNYFLMTWVCVYSYTPTAALNAFDGLFLMVVGGLGMTAPVPAGAGPFHILVKAALELYGIVPVLNPVTMKKYDPGITFATIVHTTQFVMTVCAGLFSVTYMALRKRKQNAK